MRVYTSAYAKSGRDSAVALGCFDGVHIGHQKIISATVNQAKAKSLCSVVWSFQAPPKSFFLRDSEQKGALITPFSEKRRLMRGLGVDMLVCTSFNKKIASLEPRKFFEDILVGSLRAKHIFCGYNYRFGKGGAGNTDLLKRLCEEFCVELTVFDEIKVEGACVSSSAIRNYLSEGNLDNARKMLGRSYSLRARVADGQHLGRTLGFPTVNQELICEPLPIKNGVYLTRVSFLGRTAYGVTNVGTRPTVDGSRSVAETHIFDYSGSLYGRYVRIEFLSFLREERKFDSLDALKEQIKNDAEAARLLIKKRKT